MLNVLTLSAKLIAITAAGMGISYMYFSAAGTLRSMCLFVFVFFSCTNGYDPIYYTDYNCKMWVVDVKFAEIKYFITFEVYIVYRTHIAIESHIISNY